MLGETLTDLRLSLRALGRSPGFAATAVGTLALAIGANTAVFSFIDSLLLKSLAVEEPGRLVSVGPGGSGSVGISDAPQTDHFSYPQLEALRELDVFSSVAASPTFMTTVFIGERVSPDNVQRAQCGLVSGEYFSMVGIRPLAGRLIEPVDDDVRSGGSRVVVLGETYWRRELGGDPELIGETILIQDESFTVIGVVPASFSGHYLETPADLWTPLSTQPVITRRDSLFDKRGRFTNYWLDIVGRLAPGVPKDQAEQAVNAAMLRVHEADGGEELRDFRIRLFPAGRGMSALRPQMEKPLLLLWGGTALLLLIACANLANLLLARGADRRREIGVRLALGAGRTRLLRQLLSESLILAAGGVAAGLATAAWLMPTIEAMVARMRRPNLLEASFDWRVAAFAAGLGLATVVLFGAAPAWWSVKTSLLKALSGGRGTAADVGHARAKKALIAGQFALSLILLSSTGLLIRTLGELRAVDIGIEPESVLYFGINPRGAGMPADGQDRMRRQILSRVEQLPGIEAAAFTAAFPLGGSYSTSTTQIDGEDPESQDVNVLNVRTTPGYFDALGIPLLAGRDFEDNDRFDQVAVVNQAFADRFFPSSSPIGHTLSTGPTPQRIIGVVGDVRQRNVRDEPPPMFYRPATGFEGYLGRLIFRVRGSGEEQGRAVRAAVREIAPEMPIGRTPGRLTETIGRTAALEKLLGELTGGFAALALLLAALGVYGVFNYSVARRTGEFGLRQALGAERGDLIALVLRQAAAVLAAGAAVGLVGSLFAGRLLSGILYGVGPQDPTALAGALAALTTAGLAAAYRPALRAANVSPAEALRHE